MPRGDPKKINQDNKIIYLKLEHLNSCIELDKIALGGLWNKGQWRKELIDPGRLCLGIINGSNLLAIACGWLIIDEFHLTAIAVHPDFRRKGLAQLLLSTLLKEAESQGSKRATLEVEITNDSAKALYESCGFKVAGCRSRYYKNGSDALIQWKHLHS